MGKESNESQALGPKDFLARLRVEKRPKSGVFTQKLWDEIKLKGGDPEVRNEGWISPGRW